MVKVFFKKSDSITSTMINEGQTILDAAKQINTYSKYFPTIKECFFYGLSPKSEYDVGC